MNLSKDPMLQKIKDALIYVKSNNNDEFYGWKIVIDSKKSLQALMVGVQCSPFEIYQNRNVTDHSYCIEVFSRHGQPQVMGSASFTIDPLVDLVLQVQKTFINSKMVNNKIWNLPINTNGNYENILTTDPSIATNISGAHEKMLSEINEKVKILDKVKVNSGELFTNFNTRYFETSSGLAGQKENSDIYFEIALEKLPTPNTQEVLKYKKAVSIEDAKLSQFIDSVVSETLSISATQLPKTNDDAKILIDGDAIAELIQDLISQLDSSKEYDQAPFMQKGDIVFKGSKDSSSTKLNITLDPTLPLMAMSSPFTSEGMKPIKGKVISNDKVLTQSVNNRIGQYLNKTPNFISGNIVVGIGDSSKEQLLSSIAPQECIEILTFSSLLINPNTLTWSSEIKLGKLWKNGKMQGMIKGGVVSGDFKQNLSNFNFSNEVTKINNTGGGFSSASGYVGPNHMLIKSGIKIAGE